MKKTRSQIRNERAEKVCIEVRCQMVKHGGIANNNRLYDLLNDWLKVAKKQSNEKT